MSFLKQLINLSLSNPMIKRLAVYLLFSLVLLRFLILPLYGSVQERKALVGELEERLRLKTQVLEKRQGSRTETAVVDKKDLFPHLYEKKEKSSSIQSDTLEQLIKLAEKKGLTVLNFEMMEPLLGKGVIELPVLLRVKGQPKIFWEMLKDMEKEEKIINIRSLEIGKLNKEFSFALTLSVFQVER
jgi:hypothetical protein